MVKTQPTAEPIPPAPEPDTPDIRLTTVSTLEAAANTLRELIHDGRLFSAPALFAELPVDPPDLDPTTCEAARQLQIGDPRAATADIVERTWPSRPKPST